MSLPTQTSLRFQSLFSLAAVTTFSSLLLIVVTACGYTFAEIPFLSRVIGHFYGLGSLEALMSLNLFPFLWAFATLVQILLEKFKVSVEKTAVL